MRTGAYALSLLAAPIQADIVVALSTEPKSVGVLSRAAGSPAPTTLRRHLRTLAAIGVLDGQSPRGSRRSTDYELTESGRELLAVAETLQIWLESAPEGRIALGSASARSAVKAVVEGWSTGIIRALASKPLALTELDRLITDSNYPSLERRLLAMRSAGQIEPQPGKDRGTPYVVTEWLRKAVAPIIAAVHWERTRMPTETAEVTRVDVEAAFMMTIPMLALPPDLSGTARLAVELSGSRGPYLAGVIVDVQEGRIANCTSRLRGDVSASAIGSATAWIRAATESDAERLGVSGDRHLANALVGGIHTVLFGALRGF